MIVDYLGDNIVKWIHARLARIPGTMQLSEIRLAAAAAMLVSAVVGGLAGCATSVFNPATNEPLSASTPPNMGAPTDFMRENSIVLSFLAAAKAAGSLAEVPSPSRLPCAASGPELSVVVDVMFPLEQLTGAVAAFQEKFPATTLRRIRQFL